MLHKILPAKLLQQMRTTEWIKLRNSMMMISEIIRICIQSKIIQNMRC